MASFRERRRERRREICQSAWARCSVSTGRTLDTTRATPQPWPRRTTRDRVCLCNKRSTRGWRGTQMRWRSPRMSERVDRGATNLENVSLSPGLRHASSRPVAVRPKTFIFCPRALTRALDVRRLRPAPPRARALGLSVDGSEGPKPEELSCPLPPSRHAEVRQGNQGQSLSEQI